MFNNGHFLLIYILAFYSIIFLFLSKNKNEFVLIFTIFMFFLEQNSWENEITSLITSPIRIQPSDLSLILMLFFIIKSFVVYGNFIRKLPYFIFVVIVYLFLMLFVGIMVYGYSALAEFRAQFYFVIIVLYVISTIKKTEIPYLIKRLSTYLIPLVLLAPLNMILLNNFSMSVENRQFSAFMYESIVLGFVSGLLYYKLYDKSYKLPVLFSLIFILTLPFASHRTVWAVIIAVMPFLLYWFDFRKSIPFIVLSIIVVFKILDVDSSFILDRVSAFTSFTEDSTGYWRFLVWSAVIEDATFWGHGIGSRFVVYASVIGFDASLGAHNGFIMILHYLGYFGVLILLYFLLYLLFKFFLSLKHFRKQNEVQKLVNSLGFLSILSLITYMMGYGFDVVSIVFISFAIKYRISKVENNFRYAD